MPRYLQGKASKVVSTIRSMCQDPIALSLKTIHTYFAFLTEANRAIKSY